MKERLKRTERTFIISIVGLVVAALLSLTITLLATNIARYDQQVSAGTIEELTAAYPEVAAYLDSQKPAEPHFVTIATLVKQSQERTVWNIIIWSAIPIVLTSALVGVFISRRLLRPVAESYAAQERFIQDAAHELRNPLAAMSATLESASRRSNQTDQRTIDRLERQTNRLIQINEDLLFLQRAADPTAATDQDVSKLTKKLAAGCKAAAQDKHITIRSSIQSGIRRKLVARDYEIVFRNLLDNAIKYSPEHSTVKLQLANDKSRIILRVSDQGQGIPAEEIPFVTKRFYRAGNASGQQGSGLGLALVQKVIDAYGGSLHIDSALGEGTTITVKL